MQKHVSGWFGYGCNQHSRTLQLKHAASKSKSSCIQAAALGVYLTVDKHCLH